MSVLHLSVKLNGVEFPFEGRYSSELTLAQFKKKLEMVVGIASADMKVKLHDQSDKFLTDLDVESATLAQLGVHDKAIVHVADATGMTTQFGAADGGDVSERYVLNDAAYEARSDSVRKWMKELGVDKHEIIIPDFAKVGCRCVIRMPDQPDRSGKIAFAGQTHFKPGTWIGVVYDEPVGKNDGSVDGQRYFTCEPKHGGFVGIKFVYPPEEAKDESASGIEIEEM